MGIQNFVWQIYYLSQGQTLRNKLGRETTSTFHPGLAEIPAPDGSQEVVGHTSECSFCTQISYNLDFEDGARHFFNPSFMMSLPEPLVGAGIFDNPGWDCPLHSPDYRHRVTYLGLVMSPVCSKLEGKTNTQNGLKDRHYQGHYLPASLSYTIKNHSASCVYLVNGLHW